MTLRKIFLILPLILNSNFIEAQDAVVNLHNKDKINLSVSVGNVIPLGSFSKNDFHQDDVGKAFVNVIGEPKTGVNLKLEGKYSLTDNIGIIAILSSTSNKVSDIDFQDLYGHRPTSGQGGGFRLQSFNCSFTNWITYNLLAGISAKTGNNFLTFTVKALAGYQYIKSPAVNIDDSGQSFEAATYSDIFYTNNTFLPGINKNNFAFNFGTDATFRISKKLAALVSVDYLISHLSFATDIVYTSDYSGTETGHEQSFIPYNFNKTVSFLCINAGLAYKIK